MIRRIIRVRVRARARAKRGFKETFEDNFRFRRGGSGGGLCGFSEGAGVSLELKKGFLSVSTCLGLDIGCCR